MIRSLHIITGLLTGGAETSLYKLLSRIDQKDFSAEVISLTADGPVGKRIRDLGIPVRALGLDPRRPNPLLFCRLVKWVKTASADVVQTWMYHADLVGGIAAKLVGVPAVWNIRNGPLDRKLNKTSTFLTVKACARLSGRVPRRIICCSEVTRRFHERMGYVARKMVLIPNGFDLSEFRPCPSDRATVRAELGLRAETVLIGQIARFHPQKGHRVLIEAVRPLLQRDPNIHVLLCGDGVRRENEELRSMIHTNGLEDRFHLLGPRNDIPRIMNSLDILCSPSSGEGFPNAVGEAMACAVPCVVTDAGDSALVVGESGLVVPSNSSEAIAQALQEMIALGPAGRKALGEVACERVRRHFDLRAIVARYESLYREVAAVARFGASLPSRS
jgi:glycosyltransferase involved in cell wall biosynthesis